MSGYPTPEALRRHAEHASAMADEYRQAGNIVKADQRDEDARFYRILAEREEIRMERNTIAWEHAA
ncbi:hypothetical protein ACLJYM_06260 [Rhizobium giardinii]|uniref:hypothetical protein n=1 Tax=Rhizobium giardinii TaxID=56731 RepID=UPI0039E00A6F